MRSQKEENVDLDIRLDIRSGWVLVVAIVLCAAAMAMLVWP